MKQVFCRNTRARNDNFWKISVRKTIWDLELSEHLLLNFLLAHLSQDFRTSPPQKKWYHCPFLTNFTLKRSPVLFFLPSFPNALGRITWRDMLCITAVKAGLPVAVRQLFWFIAVAASEIVTVISSNSSFISFWRSFRGIFWEVLWTLKLTQSQVGIVGLKIVNSLNRINRCVKFRKRNRLLVTFVVFFTALWTFWHLIL